MKRVFLDTGPGHPHYNMALDEALLEAHRPGGLTLRLYAWRPWALSLGYFQPAAQADPAFLASAGLVERDVHVLPEVLLGLRAVGQAVAGEDERQHHRRV